MSWECWEETIKVSKWKKQTKILLTNLEMDKLLSLRKRNKHQRS